MSKKSQNMLYESTKSLTFHLKKGETFTFSDLKIATGIVCNTDDQREAGRRYNAWVKNYPKAPVVIINKKPTIYQIF